MADINNVVYFTVSHLGQFGLQFIIAQSLLAMISSIPILTIERSVDQTLSVVVLSEMIPSTAGDKFIKQKVMRRLLNRQHAHTVIYCEKNKARALQIYNTYNQMIDKGILISERIPDPVEKFLFQAIVNKKSWTQLIAENDWDKLFADHQRKSWCIYQQWIVLICSKSFKEKEAKFLISNLTQRQKVVIREYNSLSKKTNLNIKLEKWLSKDVSQLHNIYYDVERNLLSSIKLKESFNKTVQRLRLSEILQSPVNQYEVNLGKWIYFLCIKFTDNKPPIRLHIDKQSYQWKPARVEHKRSSWKIKWAVYEKKLKSIFSQVLNLQASFTNSLEVSLLKDLRQRNSWRVSKKHVEDIMLANGFIFVSSDDEKDGTFKAINQKNAIQKVSSLEINQNSSSNNFSEGISSDLSLQNNCNRNNQFSIKKESLSQLSNSKQKPSKFTETLRNKIKNLKPKIYPLAKNLFEDPSQKQLNQSIPVKNQQNDSNEQNSFESYSFQPQRSPMINDSELQTSMDSLITKQSALNHEEYQQQNDRERNFLSKEKKVSNTILATDAIKKNADNTHQLVLSTQQKLMLSLIEKAHDSLQQFKKKYFSGIPQESLQKYFEQNKQMIDPIHRSILSLYRFNHEQVKKISNKYIRKLTQMILNIDLVDEKTEPSNSMHEQKLTSSCSIEEAAKQFVSSFDKLVSSLHGKQTSIQHAKQQNNTHQL